MTQPLKPRKLTLARVREALKQHGGTVTRKELADLVGCSPVTLTNLLDRWIAYAAGVRKVGSYSRPTYRYQEPEQCPGYEPATPTVEDLLVDNARLRAALQEAGIDDPTSDNLGHGPNVPTNHHA